MRKSLLFVSVVVLVVILIQVWFNNFVWNEKLSSPETPRNLPLAKSDIFQATPTPYSSGKIIYQKADDKDGRTVIYEFQDAKDSQNKGFAGAGTVTMYPGFPYYLGFFQRWETIPHSKDRYIFLMNPSTKVTMEKIRVNFSSTKLGVENVDMPGTIQSKPRAVIEKVPESALNELIKPDDILIIFPVLLNNKEARDENQIVVAKEIAIRRNSRSLVSF